jgi:hypothetical protein
MSYYPREMLVAIVHSVFTWLIVASTLGKGAVKDKTMFAIAATVGAAHFAVMAYSYFAVLKVYADVLTDGFLFLATAVMLTYGIRRQQRGPTTPAA